MLKVVKKTGISPQKSLVLSIIAIAAAFVATALILICVGYNPLEIYGKMIEGSTGTKYRCIETINKTIPLVVLSLGIAMAFKMKFWNIGAEGQFYLGACTASFVALNFPTLPIYVMIPLMMIAGFIGGGLWALIPAVLKSKMGTNETLVTLMMNYIAIKWISYLQYGPWRDPNGRGFPKIARFTDNAVMPTVFGVHIGWIIALVLVVVVYLVLKKSKFGYEMAVLGENEQTARYAGMNVTRILVSAVVISGGLCGLAGMMQASAVERSLSDQLSGGLGYTAIITAWLGKLHPASIVIVSFLFAILLQGGAYLQSSLQIPSSVAGLIQGIILFFVLGSEFFANYSVSFKGKAKPAVKEVL